MSVRRALLALVAVAGTATGVLVAAGGPAAALPVFGSAPVAGPSRAAPMWVVDVTVGPHDTYDRVVFRTSGGMPAWDVRYVPRVTRDGSGEPVPLLGNADIQVVLQPTDWIDHPSVQRNLTPGFPGLRQVTGAGEFEGSLTYGIGQASATGFRVFTLTGPDRLVVDVAH